MKAPVRLLPVVQWMRIGVGGKMGDEMRCVRMGWKEGVEPWERISRKADTMPCVCD